MHAEVGIDYLTATVKPEAENYARVVNIGLKGLEDEKEHGNTLKSASVLGYEGHICGSVFVGEAYQGAMVRYSSSSANSGYNSLIKEEINVTRIDLQVTIWWHTDPYYIVRRYGQSAIAASFTSNGAIKREVKEDDYNDGGYTLRIGSRTSDYYGRLYDKGRETKDQVYGNAIRFEVEIKGKRAKQANVALRSCNGTKEAFIVGFLAKWWSDRGVYIPILHTTSQMVLEPLRRDKSDTYRRLEWLRTQVRHTVTQLRLEVDDGVILEALGMNERVSCSVPLIDP